MTTKNPFNIPRWWDATDYNPQFYLDYDVREWRDEVEKDERAAKIRILDSIEDEELRKMVFAKRKEKESAQYWHDLLDEAIKTFSRELERRSNNRKRSSQEELLRKKEEVSIVDVVESYVSIWRYRPWNLIKCCMPNHADSSASMMLYTKNNTFHCFGCHAWWSQIDFIMKMDNCDLRTAIKKFLTY